VHHLATTMRGETAFDGGELDIAPSRGFGASAEVFVSERLSTQFAATFLNPEATLLPDSGSDVELGTLGLEIYSLTARYHLAPRSRFSYFAGGGAALVSFGNLEDRFGDDLELEYGTETTFLVEMGVRYRFQPRVFLDVAVSYMPLEAEAELVRNDTAIAAPSRLSLDPVTVSVGASWRF
jgi:outer membrane protein W